MKHLTEKQRYTIFVMHEKNYSQKEIADAIKKNKSTVSRELKRNVDKKSGKYNYEKAHNQYLERQKTKPRKIKFTDEVKRFVEKKINEDFSPEQIYGRAKLDKINCVSHETIYQYIWSNKKEGGHLFEHLRRNGRKYRKRGNLKDSRGIIKDRVGIDKRPKIVDEKKRFGD